jgi:hypothetical protein
MSWQLFCKYIMNQKIHFARQHGGDNAVVYLQAITQRNYFSECLWTKRYVRFNH